MALVRKGIPVIKNRDKYEIVYALFVPEAITTQTGTPLKSTIGTQRNQGIDNIYIVDAATVVSCLK